MICNFASVIIDKFCFENLLKCYESLNGKRIVGPSFFYKNGLSCYKDISLLNIILSKLLLIKIMPGKLSPIGCGYGIYFSNVNADYCKSDWLAGGCIFFHKSDLPEHPHFPYPGKAYCEDLIFSEIMKKKKFNIYISRLAKCMIDKPLLSKDNYNLKNDYQARKYLLSISKTSTLRLKIWYFIKRVLNFYV